MGLDHETGRARPRTRAAGLAVAATVAALVLGACAPPPPPLYRTVANSWGAQIGADLTDVSYGPHPRNRLDVYLPSAGAPRGTIVFVHGGGWAGGDKSERWLLPNALLSQTRRGYGLVAINYRLAGHGPNTAGVHDIAAAVDWVRTEGPAAGLDTSKVVVSGFSAGAHLATLLAVSANDTTPAGALPAVDGVVALAGAFDLTRLVGAGFGGVDTWWPTHGARVAGSPTRWVDPADPPMFVVHGVDDGILSVLHARHFRSVVASRGAASRLTYVEVDHPNLPASCRNHVVSCGVPMDQLERFLDRL